MASGGFVNFGGEQKPEIEGSSTVVGFEKWIEITSVSQGLSRSADPTSKPAEAAGQESGHYSASVDFENHRSVDTVP